MKNADVYPGGTHWEAGTTWYAHLGGNSHMLVRLLRKNGAAALVGRKCGVVCLSTESERGVTEREMPAEKRGAEASETTASKKRKVSSSPLLKTASRVLGLVESVSENKIDRADKHAFTAAAPLRLRST